MDKDVQQAGPSSTSEQSESDKKNSEESQQLSPNALKVAAADCLNSWICYLQMMNNMCTAGLRLSQSLTTLSQLQNIPLALQCQTSWEELSKSTVVASNVVKTHIANAMQDMSIGDTFTESDAQRQQDHNQQIIAENLLTFINIQYQFSMAGCEYFSAMAVCPMCNAQPKSLHASDCALGVMQLYFARAEGNSSQRTSPQPSNDSPLSGRDVVARQHSPHSPYAMEALRGQSPIQGFSLDGRGTLHTTKPSFSGSGTSRGLRSPLHFPLFPLNCQRRWSEAAATEMGGGDAGETAQTRRWSMPWDVQWGGHAIPSKLTVPAGSGALSQERSRSTTPEATPPLPITGTQPVTPVLPGGEGLAEAIRLLSCRPATARCSIPQTAHPHLHHHFPGWPPETHEERVQRRVMYPGPPSQRGNWQSIDVPHASGMSVTEHYDIFPPVLPLISRKSSSSTDSSSCLSIHSRSTTSSSERGSASEASGTEAMRLHTNFYSMWSGSEHLPFIRLPESQEPQDDSDTDDPPTEKSIGNFPKPT